MKTDTIKATAEAAEGTFFLGDDWFDPLEAGVRTRIRGFIEELLEAELDVTLGRDRYERPRVAETGVGGQPVVGAGHRNGHRERGLMGTFGPVTVRVPRARLEAPDGETVARKRRVLVELAKIAFAHLRRAVKWGALGSDPETGSPVNGVELVPSELLDASTAAAISEVKQTASGALSIKLHDKHAALVSIGKELGMFIERHEHGGPGDFERMSDDELRQLAMRALGQGAPEGGKPN